MLLLLHLRRVLWCQVMGPGCKIYALKRIRLAGRDAEAASGFIDEIRLLQRLRHKPNIIQLVDSQVGGSAWQTQHLQMMGSGLHTMRLSRPQTDALAAPAAPAAACCCPHVRLLLLPCTAAQVFDAEGLIYMVQEYGEIDLARLLAKHAAARQAGQGDGQGGLAHNLDENFIRLYWQQMLQARAWCCACACACACAGRQACSDPPAPLPADSGPPACSCRQAVSGVHDQRIVHSDLKPANFLLVEGQLKLIDFGIAKAISGDTTSIARESQVAAPAASRLLLHTHVHAGSACSTRACTRAVLLSRACAAVACPPGWHTQLHEPRGHPGRLHQHPGRPSNARRAAQRRVVARLHPVPDGLRAVRHAPRQTPGTATHACMQGRAHTTPLMQRRAPPRSCPGAAVAAAACLPARSGAVAARQHAVC